jgi:hypothetical protein
MSIRAVQEQAKSFWNGTGFQGLDVEGRTIFMNRRMISSLKAPSQSRPRTDRS